MITSTQTFRLNTQNTHFKTTILMLQDLIIQALNTAKNTGHL